MRYCSYYHKEAVLDITQIYPGMPLASALFIPVAFYYGSAAPY